MLKSSEIRKSFIDFFMSKNHQFIKSSSVIPNNDPTLLFTNSGMNQFKPIFFGHNPEGLKRVCNSQKCLRVSGKHNDLDVVGRDNYHHTFFEMLGNWSFNDYYKKESISWSWELLTKVWKLPKERLFVSVYKTDDESWKIWKEVSNLPDDRIMRFDEKDNFWEMGDTGPCGPCSEIHYDRGDLETQEETFKDPILGVNGENDRYVEIWNIVFMEKERLTDGTLIPLSTKNIDTGMGFERICSILQNTNGNYETDLFKPLIDKIVELSGVEYKNDETGTPHRVISDHIRSLVFSITDGLQPSNKGSGYVLRRLLRRGSLFCKMLNINEPFMYKLVPVVIDIMGDVYPEIKDRQEFVIEIIKNEEIRFLKNLNNGIKQFNSIISKMSGNVLSGFDSFKLYDTYGFPIDLTQMLCEQHGLDIDIDGFNNLIEEQKERSRKNLKEEKKLQ